MSLIVGLLLYVNVHVALVGSVSRGAVDVKTFISVECRSNADIKVQFVRTSVNKTNQTIAECESPMGACYLLQQSYGKNYAIFHTSYGAMFSVVTGVEETHGTYYCCETYNPDNCVDLGIMQLISNQSTNNSNPEILDNINNKATDSSDQPELRTLLIFIVVLICVIVIPATLANMLMRCRSKDRSIVCCMRETPESFSECSMVWCIGTTPETKSSAMDFQEHPQRIVELQHLRT